MARLLVILLSVVGALLGATPLRAADQPLSGIDWSEAIASIPNLTVIPEGRDCPPFTPIPLPCVGVTLPLPVTVADPLSSARLVERLGGFLDVRDPLYGDLDGDGVDEAALRLESGGTGGSLGFLLFRATAAGPRLVTGLGGERMAPRTIADGLLTVWHVWYAGFEPNCCPTAAVETTYTLQGDTLVPVAQVVLAPTGSRLHPATPQEATVLAYYHALSLGRLDAAYAFLSPRMQAAEPFDAWSAGFAALERVDVVTQAGSTEGEVLVWLTAVDKLPEGGQRVQRFTGRWQVIANPDFVPNTSRFTADFRPAWLLDLAQIDAEP